MRDTANVCPRFTLSKSPRLIFIGPLENVFNVIAACANDGKLFYRKRAVFVFICLDKPLVWCRS